MFRRFRVLLLVFGGLFVSAAAFTESDEPDLPKEIAVPPGYRRLLKVEGKGVQIYKSNELTGGKLVWAFEAPLADLFNDKGDMVGYHYEGPSWEALDGSRVVRDGAVPVKSVPAPNPQKNIPWLLVKVNAKAVEPGAFTQAAYIQRLQTSGGKEPINNPKRAGTRVGVPYTALYILYTKE